MYILNSLFGLLARPAVAAGVGVLGFVSTGFATPIVVQPTAATAQDTFVYQAMPTFNFDSSGFEHFLVLGKSVSGHDLSSLIQFDLTGVSLAAGEKATLNLFVDPTESTGFPGVSPTAGGPATADVAAASSAWSPAFVQFGQVSGGAVIASASIDHTGYWATFDVTPTVQSWLDGTAVNNGFVITQDSAVNHNGWVGLVFDASGGTSRPFLQVAAVPEPAALGAAAAGLFLIGRRRRG